MFDIPKYLKFVPAKIQQFKEDDEAVDVFEDEKKVKTEDETIDKTTVKTEDETVDKKKNKTVDKPKKGGDKGTQTFTSPGHEIEQADFEKR